VKAAPLKLHAPITQKGTLGYLLWLRQNMPGTYLTVAAKVPAVAAFEAAVRAPPSALQGLYAAPPFWQRQSQAMGDYGDYFSAVASDASSDASDLDLSSALDSSSPVTVDFTDALTNDPLDASVLNPDEAPDVSTPDVSIVDQTPALPPIAPAAPAAAAAASSSSMTSSLPAIAQIVAATAPIVAAVINSNTASVNAATVAKTAAAAQVQLAAAAAGQAPLQSGVVAGANGSYIAAVTPFGQDSVLSSTIGGVPLWLLALGGVGAALLLAN
jgi:hypothetical protein